MLLAITSQGKDLNALVDERFGRCQYFVLVDTDKEGYTAIENTSGLASGGAGIKSAQSLAERGVAAVLTGFVGPNAVTTLNAAGIKVYAGAAGTVREALQGFKEGRFGPTTEANVESHHGLR